jgi:hypothetical protein
MLVRVIVKWTQEECKLVQMEKRRPLEKGSTQSAALAWRTSQRSGRTIKVGSNCRTTKNGPPARAHLNPQTRLFDGRAGRDIPALATRMSRRLPRMARGYLAACTTVYSGVSLM